MTPEQQAEKLERLTRYWTTFEDGIHSLDPAPPGKGEWLKRSDVLEVATVLRAQGRPYGLADYTEHRIGCPRRGLDVECRSEDNCSCGLDALLAASQAQGRPYTSGVTDEHSAAIMDAFAALRDAQTHEDASEAISRVIAAIRADDTKMRDEKQQEIDRLSLQLSLTQREPRR